MSNSELTDSNLSTIKKLTQSLLDDEKFRSFSHDRFSAQLQTIIDKATEIEANLFNVSIGDPNLAVQLVDTGLTPEQEKLLNQFK